MLRNPENSENSVASPCFSVFSPICLFNAKVYTDNDNKEFLDGTSQDHCTI
jgi:hypothetical protein